MTNDSRKLFIDISEFQFQVWNYGSTIIIQNTVGPLFNPPLKTRFCEFNESETLLMVTGLTQLFDFEGNIFVAVFSVPGR